VEEIFRSYPRAKLLRAHVRAFADAALQFEIVYRLDLPAQAGVQHAIHVAVLKRFRQEGIQFLQPGPPEQTAESEKAAPEPSPGKQPRPGTE